jgi:hypothetical protein
MKDGIRDPRKVFNTSKTLNPLGFSLKKKKTETISSIVECDETPIQRRIINLSRKIIMDDLLDNSISNILDFLSMSELTRVSQTNNYIISKYYCQKLQKYSFRYIL